MRRRYDCVPGEFLKRKSQSDVRRIILKRYNSNVRKVHGRNQGNIMVEYPEHIQIEKSRKRLAICFLSSTAGIDGGQLSVLFDEAVWWCSERPTNGVFTDTLEKIQGYGGKTTA